jgi:hypothetical protein
VSQPADVKAAAQKWAEVWCARGGQDVDAIGSARSVRAPWTSREGSQHRAAVGGSICKASHPHPAARRIATSCRCRRLNDAKLRTFPGTGRTGLRRRLH